MGGLFGGGAKQTYATTLAAQQGATQQAAANREAAIAGTEMSMVNQISPNGTLTYNQTGTSANNNPIYTATTTYDPVTQRALDAEKRLDYKTNEASEGLIDRARAGILGQNLDISDTAINAKVQGMINPRLGQRFAQDESRLKDSLINRGMREGSQGFNDAMLSFNQGKTDAYTQEGLANRQQAIQEIVLPRNQLINETSGLAGMQQIQGPQFVNTPQTSVAPADYQRVAEAQISAQNAGQQRRQSAYGGLFSAIGSGINAGAQMYARSDRRVKTNIRRVGRSRNGFTIYTYFYRDGGPMDWGVMAQEVEVRKPSAVATFGGVKHVDYAEALKEAA
ncbi:MAG: tail fiber domain-containing protein [Paracoccaceae bacterium]